MEGWSITDIRYPHISATRIIIYYVFQKCNTFFKYFFIFNTDDIYFSPGRVNLIGEHTDYNGGNVFPCTLSIGTYAIVSKGTDSKVIFNSLNFKELGTISFDLNNMIYDKKDYWTNYPKGVTKSYKEKIGYPYDFRILSIMFYVVLFYLTILYLHAFLNIKILFNHLLFYLLLILLCYYCVIYILIPISSYYILFIMYIILFFEP